MLVELYTSENCAKCPRADEQLAMARHSKLLWKAFVPVGFHVDYWDRMGWADKLSDPAFADRQYQYARKWDLKRVYTPMFVKDGLEYRDNPMKLYYWVRPVDDAGLMEAMQVRRMDFEVRYKPPSGADPWRIHYALLGFNIRSHITAGENNRRDLMHHFSVLSYGSVVVETRNGVAWAVVHFPEKLPGLQKGLAFWVTAPDDPAPVQALGGYLSKEDS